MVNLISTDQGMAFQKNWLTVPSSKNKLLLCRYTLSLLADLLPKHYHQLRLPHTTSSDIPIDHILIMQSQPQPQASSSTVPSKQQNMGIPQPPSHQALLDSVQFSTQITSHENGEENYYANGEENSYEDGEENRYAGGEENRYADGKENRYVDGEENRYVDGEENRYADGEENRYADGEENRYADSKENGYKDSEENRYADGEENRYADGEENSYEDDESGSKGSGVSYEEELNSSNEEGSKQVLRGASQMLLDNGPLMDYVKDQLFHNFQNDDSRDGADPIDTPHDGGDDGSHYQVYRESQDPLLGEHSLNKHLQFLAYCCRTWL